MTIRPIEMIDEMVELISQELHVDVMKKTRDHDVVLPRAALFNVCRGYYSATTLGKYFGKNHATILHHYRNHEANMLLPHYGEIYFKLQGILEDYNNKAKDRRMTLENQIKQLRSEVKALRKLILKDEEDNEKEGAHDLRASLHRRTEVGDHQHHHSGEQHPVE